MDAGEGLRCSRIQQALWWRSKNRFIAPVRALLALRTNAGHEQRRPDGDDGQIVATGGVGSRGVSGFLGFGAIGAAH